MTDDHIQNLQDDIYFTLLGDAELAGVSVFRRRTPLPRDEDGNVVAGDSVMIDDKLDQVLAGVAERGGKVGAAIIVMLPDVKLESIQNAALPMTLKAKVRVVENQLFNEGENGTGVSSSQLALHVMQYLHRRAFRGGNTLRLDRDKPVEEVPLPGHIVHEINMDWSQVLEAIAKVATPVIAQAGGAITLSCATVGATIRYTLDGSFPGSGNAQAVIYSAPFTPAPGSYVLRVSAEKADMQPSDDELADITIS